MNFILFLAVILVTICPVYFFHCFVREIMECGYQS